MVCATFAFSVAVGNTPCASVISIYVGEDLLLGTGNNGSIVGAFNLAAVASDQPNSSDTFKGLCG